MISLEYAIEKVRKNNPDRILSCVNEYEDFYAIGSYERGWDGNPDTVKIGRGYDCVYKNDGSVKIYNWIDDELDSDKFIKQIDIRKYLPEEDVNFLNKYVYK